MKTSKESNMDQPNLQNDIQRVSSINLLTIVDNIRSELGPLVNRQWRPQEDFCQKLSAKIPIDANVAAAKLALEKLLHAFSDAIGDDVLSHLIRVEGGSLKTARSSVLSWLDIAELLVRELPHGTTVPYTPADFKAAIATLNDDELGDCLWATDRKWIKTSRGRSIDRLMALALARSLRNAGHDVKKIDVAMQEAFGVSRDAMRKWEGLVRQEMGDEKVDDVFDQVEARSLFPVPKDWLLAQPFIHTAGVAYRRGIGTRHVPEMKGNDDYHRMLDELHHDDAADNVRAPSND